MTSIIIVNYNGKEYTEKCIRSIERSLQKGTYEIIVVDNDSSDGSLKYLEEKYGNSNYLSLKQNYGFGYANNLGVQKTSGEYLFFLNNDTEIFSDVLNSMVNFMNANPDAGIVGPRLLNSDGSFQISFGKYPSLINEFITRKRKNRKHDPTDKNDRSEAGFKTEKVDWVSGAALLIRRRLFDSLGGFDAKYFMYFEDSDICLRVQKAGYSIYWLPECSLIHHKGKSYTESYSNVFIEYRKSQLYYYGKNRPVSEQLFLRIYLFVKFAVQILSEKKRDCAIRVLKMVLSAKY